MTIGAATSLPSVITQFRTDVLKAIPICSPFCDSPDIFDLHHSQLIGTSSIHLHHSCGVLPASLRSFDGKNHEDPVLHMSVLLLNLVFLNRVLTFLTIVRYELIVVPELFNQYDLLLALVATCVNHYDCLLLDCYPTGDILLSWFNTRSFMSNSQRI